MASIAIVLAALYFAQTVLVPLALALLFAFLLAPIVERLERWHLGRIASTLIVVLVGLGILGSIGWIVEQRFAVIVSNLPEYRAGIKAKFHRLTQSGAMVAAVQREIQHTVAEAQSPATAPSTRPAGVAAALSRLPFANAAKPPEFQPATLDDPWPVRVIPQSESPFALAIEFLGKIIYPFATAGLVVVLVIFMLIGREDLRDRVIYLLGYGRLHMTTEALDEATSRVSHYLMSQGIINALFGVAVGVGLWVIDLSIGHGGAGLADALVAGMICGVLRFIPYVGTWIGALIPLSIAFAAFPGNAVFLATLALFVGLELICSQAVEPNILGSSTGITPMAVLVAAVFWTWLWGPIGLLLSTPLTVLVVVMGKYIPQLEFINVLLSEKPPLDPATRVYQRLIAGDDDEAIEMARQYFKEMPLEKVYDQVLIPALAAVEQDWRHDKFDEAHYDFVRKGFRDIIETLGEEQKKRDADHDPAPADADETPRPSLPKGAHVRVLCIPARTESDELVGLMLAQLLERRGYQVTGLPAESLASETIDQITQCQSDVLVISALPPKAVVHCRYLLKKLSERSADLNVVIGLWTGAADSQAMEFASARSALTLADAQDQLQQLAHAICLQSATGDGKSTHGQ